MKTILVGNGEVGSGMAEVLSAFYPVLVHDPAQERIVSEEEACEVLIIAFPWGSGFEEGVRAYQALWSPRFTVILSTVPVGVSSRLQAHHSPISGIHPHLAKSIRIHTRWLGGPVSQELISYFEGAQLRVKTLPTAEETEFLKLRSTTLYGINIEFARYSGDVCQKMGFDYAHVNEWDADYNALYEGLGLPQMKRYILTPPKGKIGGHCVYPNAQILGAQFPDEMIDVILKRNGAEVDLDERPYEAN